MDNFGNNNIPLSYIHAYHSKERELYSRMVLNLQMDPDLSMDIISFWLWQEERGHGDIIQRMNSLTDPMLIEVSVAARTYIETLRLDPSDQKNQGFRDQAIRGIDYFRNSVGHKALRDIKKKAEDEETVRQMKLLINQMTQIDLFDSKSKKSIENITGSDELAPNYVPHGEGTSRRRIGENSITDLTMADIERAIQYSIKSLVPQLLYNSGMVFNNPNQITPPLPYQQHVGSRQHNISIDERTLFVTFSNGYPLTQEELYTFFMRHYGDVESVTIEEPAGGDGRAPLYAHVSFYSLGTVLRILDGNLKVKFMMNGKHLWARRFFPKKNHHGDKAGDK